MMGAISKAVEKTNAAPAATPAQVSPAEIVTRAINAQTAEFRQVLPKHVDPERFARIVLSAVKSTPLLMECFRTNQGKSSLLIAAMQAASIGLEPNTPLQQAWLLPRRNKETMECQLNIGYRGYLKLARRSGEIASIKAVAVHEGDHFRYEYGAEDDVLEHRPGDDTDGNPLTHVWARVRFKDGASQFVVLTRTQVEKRRAMSDSYKRDVKKGTKYSPWHQWEEEMWCKTAIRVLVPYLDLSADVSRAINNDDSGVISLGADGTFESNWAELAPVADDDDTEAAPAVEEKTTPEVVDTKTGEIIETPKAEAS